MGGAIVAAVPAQLHFLNGVSEVTTTQLGRVSVGPMLQIPRTGEVLWVARALPTLSQISREI